MRPVKIYLADLTYTTLSLATEAFPLNIGFVAAYCQKIYGNEVDIRLFKYIDDLDQALHNDPPDILGLSNYPWNFRIGIEFFRLLESISPRTIRVMGGPNIPLHDTERTAFILQNPEIDFYSYLEGEQAFVNLVERAIETGLDKQKMKMAPVDGMLFRINDSEVAKGIFLPRRKLLDEIPSPYLTGFMDKFFDGKLSPMLETNRGCPFQCTFCHEGNKLISKVNSFSLDRVLAEIDYVAAHVPDQVSNLMFADPNFGMYARDSEICRHISNIQAKQNWPRNIFASTGKNKKERIGESLKMLNGTMKLWMSVQSMNPVVLKHIKRDNIKLDQMMGLSEVFENMGVPTFSELILGLPGDTYESHLSSIGKLVDSGVDFISTYTLMLLNGTHLNTEEGRRTNGFGTHFRIIPRDFGRLSNGAIAIETEEVVTSSHWLSLDDYVGLRVFHLVVNVLYNGKAFGPLFRHFKQNDMSVSELLARVLRNVETAPPKVVDFVGQFKQQTRDELWDSDEELLKYASREENYEKLVAGDLGANLLQTYVARSLQIMSHWADYLFDQAEKMVLERGKDSDQLLILSDLKSYCLGRVHNIWGDDRYQTNPSYKLRYDIPAWMSHSKEPLSHYNLAKPKYYQFSFTEMQSSEMDKYVARFGTTPTGLGRIMNKINMTSIWRHALVGNPPIMEIRQ